MGIDFKIPFQNFISDETTTRLVWRGDQDKIVETTQTDSSEDSLKCYAPFIPQIETAKAVKQPEDTNMAASEHTTKLGHTASKNVAEPVITFRKNKDKRLKKPRSKKLTIINPPAKQTIQRTKQTHPNPPKHIQGNIEVFLISDLRG